MLIISGALELPERDVGPAECFTDGGELEEKTPTVLARDLRIGDVLVSAALGGVWDARIEAKRTDGCEVFLQLAGCMPVCLEVFEVCEVRHDN